jgi:hypothetical protein
MIKREWDNDEWDILVRTVSRGNCILMLGPDASLEEINGTSRPLTEILASELAEKLETGDKSGKIDPSNLTQTAHYYCMEAGRNGLEAKVEAFCEKRADVTDDFHRDLAALPFYFTVTACPDRMFYNALREAGKKPVVTGYNFRGVNPAMVMMGTVEEPLLFNLYGTLRDSYSLVLTESDLLDFLVAVVSGNPPLPKNIVSELHAGNKSFLFLGFGFKHWYLRVLLHVLQGDKKEAHSIALEQFPQNVEEFEKTILFYEEQDCKINIYSRDMKAFVKELRERYEKMPGTAAEPAAKPKPEGAPTVFICHASENKESARFLHEKLETAGIDCWLDKEDLRGGDDWDQVIKKAIEKEIDYVVILQSNDLAKKYDGYVNKEINMALDRQDEFKRGIRFVIPITIEECPLREELEHLHTVDLSGGSVDELVKAIRRDQLKRKGGQ